MPQVSAGGETGTLAQGSLGDTETVQCPVCGHEVLRSNWTLHELRCARGTCQCEHCSVQLHESELDAHWKTECPFTSVECVYCELPIKRGELEDHVRRCGARTEQCKKCGHYIRLIDRIEHETWACSTIRSQSARDEDVVASPAQSPEDLGSSLGPRPPTLPRRPLRPQQPRSPLKLGNWWKPFLLPAAVVVIAAVVHGLQRRGRGAPR
jgi:hypothetical protein